MKVVTIELKKKNIKVIKRFYKNVFLLSPDTLKQERFHYIVFSKLKTPNISKTEPPSQILIQKISPVYPLQDLTGIHLLNNF